jgi:N-acetyl-gamma-glutamyl-phosphate reductase
MQIYAFMMHTIRVGVLGASGYTGREVCALVAGHPHFRLAFATANAHRGTTLRVRAAGAVHAIALAGTDEVSLADADLVFCALPHGASAEWVVRALAAGVRVVDLSSDLRPGHGGHPEALPPGVPGDAPYGLPELAAPGWGRAAIAGARVVANPGCYATSILVALAPLARAGLIAPGATVSIAAASGVSGAGASPRPELLFAEVTENFKAYGVGNAHRHLHEMRAAMAACGADCDLLFTPHLLPVDRGILSTITVPLAAPLDDAMAPFLAAYAHEPFVELAAEPPTLREVAHRNVVRLAARVPRGVRRPTLQLFSAIDNLVKGAAGQAVQNANLMCGLDETAGLPR